MLYTHILFFANWSWKSILRDWNFLSVSSLSASLRKMQNETEMARKYQIFAQLHRRPTRMYCCQIWNGFHLVTFAVHVLHIVAAAVIVVIVQKPWYKNMTMVRKSCSLLYFFQSAWTSSIPEVIGVLSECGLDQLVSVVELFLRWQEQGEQMKWM